MTVVTSGMSQGSSDLEPLIGPLPSEFRATFKELFISQPSVISRHASLSLSKWAAPFLT